MGTAWIEVTRWRGVGIDRTLFGPVLRLGWIGVGISRRNLADWVAEWRASLAKALSNGVAK